MSTEERLLENWKKSNCQSKMLVKDYSISANNVFLSITRVYGDSCPAKGINIKCPLKIDSIKTAIEKLSGEVREKLL